MDALKLMPDPWLNGSVEEECCYYDRGSSFLPLINSSLTPACSAVIRLTNPLLSFNHKVFDVPSNGEGYWSNDDARKRVSERINEVVAPYAKICVRIGLSQCAYCKELTLIKTDYFIVIYNMGNTTDPTLISRARLVKGQLPGY